MENITQIVNKVKQAPWRVQRQWIGLLLLAIVMAALVAGLSINVTTRAAINGRQVLMLTRGTEDMVGIDENKQENAAMETELARLSATEKMQARAMALGFHPATSEEITYISVPGYVDNPPINLTTRQASLQPSVMKVEYSETLFDWLTRKMAAGVNP